MIRPYTSGKSRKHNPVENFYGISVCFQSISSLPTHFTAPFASCVPPHNHPLHFYPAFSPAFLPYILLKHFLPHCLPRPALFPCRHGVAFPCLLPLSPARLFDCASVQSLRFVCYSPRLCLPCLPADAWQCAHMPKRAYVICPADTCPLLHMHTRARAIRRMCICADAEVFM